jgi:peptidyl-prolyl cis-trans isomerase SurA
MFMYTYFLRSISLVILVGLTVIGLSSCGTSQNAGNGSSDQGETIATIGNYTLTMAEYERQFIKNNGGVEAAIESNADERSNFLNLLVKYRLKVLEAKSKGFHEDPAIIEELGEYRNSLAIPYFTERAVIDPNVMKLYERRQEEIRLAHILIRAVTDTIGNPDEAATDAKLQETSAALKSGMPFAEAAMKFSDDESTKEKGGDLNWFTAGMTLPDFDNAAYTLAAGETYPEPIQTMFGYHFIKMLDRKPSRGEIHVSHILARFDQENPEDTTTAYEKISLIMDSLKSNISFETLAKNNSDDPQSGKDGGDLSWGGRRRFVPEFEDAAYLLKVGEISAPVRSQFGYHIIKMLGERPPKTFEESRQELKDIYRRYAYTTDNNAFLDSLKKTYNLKMHTGTVDKLQPMLDTTTTTSAAGWYNNISEEMMSATVLSMTGNTISVGDMIKLIERSKELQSTSVRKLSMENVILRKIGDDEVLKLATANLETRYPEFADLMQEYREGVLLFRAEQDAVWNKVSIDSVSLMKYWEEHKSEYSWPDRVSFSEIFVTSDSLSKVLNDSLAQNVPFDEIALRHTQRTGYKAKRGDWGYQPVDANDLSEKSMKLNIGDVVGPFKFQYGYSIIKVTGKDPARVKDFSEAYSEVSSKFQEYESKRLENEWIEGLKEKFGVDVNASALDGAFKNMNESQN